MSRLILAVATGNKHKIGEFREIFRSLTSEHDIQVLSENEAIELFRSKEDIELYEQPEETGSTFGANAFIKASALYAFLEAGIRKYIREGGGAWNVIVAADDSGLCVDALGGAPGVLSARYASLDGGNASDTDNVNKLLKNMKDVPEGKRSAHFACAISAILVRDAYKPFELLASEGRLNGEIYYEARGSSGFGYDPVMYIPSLGKCVAELTPENKNALSHRAEALKKLAEKYFTLVRL